MLSCKEVSRLISDSLEVQLPLRQRVSLRVHLFMCSFCSRFRRQMLFLHEAAHAFASAGATDRLPLEIRLSADARARIHAALERAER